MLQFRANPEKIVNAVAYFASKCGGSTKMKICKLLYFADKEHLLQYGRPITGDTYVRMQYGPTPNVALNMMRGRAPVRATTMFQSKVAVTGNDVRSLSTPDMQVFSRSDLRIMDEIIERYGSSTAAKLSKLSHAEATWQKTPGNQLIDFDLFFEGHPEAALTHELVSPACASRPKRLQPNPRTTPHTGSRAVVMVNKARRSVER